MCPVNGTSHRDMKRSKKKQKFIMLEHTMCDSEAFISLSHSALRVFLSILRQKKSFDHGTTDENPLVCPYGDMVGVTSTASKLKGILELEEKGFIKCKHGGLYKQANCFLLSGDWINWRTQPKDGVKKRTKPNFKKQKSTSNIEAVNFNY
jgi:hypothetical protein